MNETRDLIIGIDFGKKYSQICYYDRKAEEARSLPVKVGSSQYETPTCLCRREEQGDYCVGLEAEYFAREKAESCWKIFTKYPEAEKKSLCQENRKNHGNFLHIFSTGC